MVRTSPLIQIDDATDARLGDYVRLRESSLRKSLEATQGLFIAEGDKVIRRALAAGCRPRSFLLAPRWIDGLRAELARYPDVAVYVVSEALAEQVTGFHVHRGALGSFHRPTPTDLDDLLDAQRLAVVEDVVDHANVGAIFRAAAALGVSAVLVTPQCADPLYRRSIKVSMGAVFQVPWTRIDPWPGGIDRLKAAGYVVAGMTLGDGAITLDELVVEDHQKLALVFGTEGHGLGPQTTKVLDRKVTIPMMGGVDSLNVAASSAVAFYATR